VDAHGGFPDGPDGRWQRYPDRGAGYDAEPPGDRPDRDGDGRGFEPRGDRRDFDRRDAERDDSFRVPEPRYGDWPGGEPADRFGPPERTSGSWAFEPPRDAPLPREPGYDADPTDRDGGPRGTTYGARGPALDAPRGPGLDTPRRSGLDAPHGPGLDAPRGAGLDAPRGPGLDAPRGAGLDVPRGPGLDAPRGAGLDAPRAPGPDALRGPGFDGPGFDVPGGLGPDSTGGKGFDGRGPGPTLDGRGPALEGRGPALDGRGPGGPGFDADLAGRPPRGDFDPPAPPEYHPTQQIDRGALRRPAGPAPAPAPAPTVYRSRRPGLIVLLVMGCSVIQLLLLFVLVHSMFAGNFAAGGMLASIFSLVGVPVTAMGIYALVTGAPAAGGNPVHAWLRAPTAYLPVGLVLLIAAALAAR
jgi:hypothetical protein